jgi:tetratricopeptide (TPR) repeat protein
MTSDLVPVEEAIRLHDLALREGAAGRLGNALQAGQAALEIFDRYPDGSPAQVAAALHTVGLIHEELGHYTDARAAFHCALAILDHNDPQPVQLWTATLAGAARLDRLLGRLEDAERLYLDAIEIAETVFGRATITPRACGTNSRSCTSTPPASTTPRRCTGRL